MDELNKLLEKGASSINEVQAIRLAVVRALVGGQIRSDYASAIRAFLLDIESTIKG